MFSDTSFKQIITSMNWNFALDTSSPWDREWEKNTIV
jgi:hypothetical protein